MFRFSFESKHYMARGYTLQRRQHILAVLQQNGEVQVDQLSQQLNTSEVTIRKDLKALESSGLLLRRYGGAVPLPGDLIDNESNKVSDRKSAIAAAAAQRIGDHQRLIIDYGSTTAALIPHLEHKRGLVVMTNSLTVARQLLALENEPTLLMTGGTWDAQSESFQGQVAEQVLASYDFDHLFIGCDGIDLQRGTTTFHELMSLSRAMAKAARNVVVLAESDKTERRIPNLELAWQQVNLLITDSGMTAQQQQSIEYQGVQVETVAPAQG